MFVVGERVAGTTRLYTLHTLHTIYYILYIYNILNTRYNIPHTTYHILHTTLPKTACTSNTEHRQCSMYDTIGLTEEEGADMGKIENGSFCFFVLCYPVFSSLIYVFPKTLVSPSHHLTNVLQ